MNQIKLELKGLPPSLNTLYPTGKHGKRFLDTRAREYKFNLMENLMAVGYKQTDIPKDAKLVIKICFYMPNDVARGRDVGNMGKLIGDALAEYFGYDDNANKVYDEYLRRRDGDIKTMIFIEELKI